MKKGASNRPFCANLISAGRLRQTRPELPILKPICNFSRTSSRYQQNQEFSRKPSSARWRATTAVFPIGTTICNFSATSSDRFHCRIFPEIKKFSPVGPYEKFARLLLGILAFSYTIWPLVKVFSHLYFYLKKLWQFYPVVGPIGSKLNNCGFDFYKKICYNLKKGINTDRFGTAEFICIF